MQSRNLVILAIAILIGLFAVLVVNGVFSGVEQRQEQIAEQNRMVKIVVASQEVAFGTPLSMQNVRLANWPANSVPVGAFTTIEDATKARVALRPIVPGEPVLASKVSGANGRATIAANLPPGQLAMAIPINDVTGAGGFVRPGDVVDVLVTRRIPGEGASEADKMTDVVLQSVPVLAVDQISDENNTKPAISKTATLQVDSNSAQKLALAQQVGVLTLALRNVGDNTVGPRSTVVGRDLSASRLYMRPKGQGVPVMAMRAPSMPAPRLPAPAPTQFKPIPTGPSMTVVRGTKTSEESVYHGY
jgi:pilus assembly protein CpaB